MNTRVGYLIGALVLGLSSGVLIGGWLALTMAILYLSIRR